MSYKIIDFNSRECDAMECLLDNYTDQILDDTLTKEETEDLDKLIKYFTAECMFILAQKEIYEKHDMMNHAENHSFRWSYSPSERSLMKKVVQYNWYAQDSILSILGMKRDQFKILLEKVEG